MEPDQATALLRTPESLAPGEPVNGQSLDVSKAPKAAKPAKAVKPPKPPPVLISTQQVKALLANTYPTGEWAFLLEVPARTGGVGRLADAVAVNLWKSRGYAIHGFEIKISRGDWLRELKQPAKAEDIYRYCNHWTIVAPAGIVRLEELPPTWGLIEVVLKGSKSDGAAASADLFDNEEGVSLSADQDQAAIDDGLVNFRLRTTVAPPKLKPEPIDLPFFASLIRRAHEGVERLAATRLLSQRTQSQAADRAYVEAEVARRSRQAEEKLASMQKRMQDIETETGLDLSSWKGPSLRTIKLAQMLEQLGHAYGEAGVLSKLERLADDLEKGARTVREAVSACGLQRTEGA